MTPKEYRDWQRYFEAEPFGQTHADLFWAQLLNLIYDVNRDPSRSPARKLEDWAPSLRQEIDGDADSLEAQKRRQVEYGRQWAAAFRGGVRRAEKRAARMERAKQIEAERAAEHAAEATAERG